jgi:glycosyltransferase involved in cell wall biosynthesis
LIRDITDPRIVLIEQTNQGLTRTLNSALRIAKGEYIARQDADDISRPDRFTLQVEFLDYHPEAGLVGSVCLCMDEEGEIIGQTPPVTDIKKLRKVLETEVIPLRTGL